MAEQVDVKIVTVDAVNNLADLKKAIKDAKDNLATLDLGSKAYRDQLKQVIDGQNLLRAAMNGTTATAEHLKDAIDKEGTSYNALVNQMANLKREFRSATTEAERADIGGRIKEINDELKRMDAMKGDFQRNVGDYFNQVTAPLKSVIQDLPSGLNAIKQPMDDVTKSLSLMGKQPILGILGLLAPLISDIAKGLKDNETAMAGIKKLMDSLKPVMDFFSGILQNVVEYVGDLISQAANFLGSSGIFNKIVKGVMGVGNAILQFVIAPFKAVGAAVKVFKEQGIKGIGDAARAMNEEFNKGIAFKQNFKSGQAVADAVISGAKSKKKETKKAGKEMAKDLLEGLQEGLADIGDELQKEFDDIVAKMEKAQEDANKRAQKREADNLKGLENGTKHRLELNEILTTDEREKANQQYAIQKESNDRRLALLKQFRDEALARDDWDTYLSYDQEIADLEVQIETDKLREEKRLREQDVKDAKEAAKQKMATMTAYASGVSGLTSSLADILENEGKEAKNLRIAAATIDMISGAVTAFSTAQQLGPIAGPIVGAINAAAVVASGLANIAKIRSTNVSKNSTPSTNAPETPATVSAPVLETAVPTTTVVNGASTEAALNRASEPQKVYILQSDIEAAGDTSRVQVAESSF